MERLVLAAKLENLNSMIDFIKDGARSKGFDEKKINQVQLAAEEVLVNIINYAYPDKNGEIEIILKPEENKGFVVEVIDSGIAYNPLLRPDPDVNLPMEKREIGGLGVYLLRKLMDKVSYKRENNSNILTFIKY
jgi:serine/threonine-protein kinase RsbW